MWTQQMEFGDAAAYVARAALKIGNLTAIAYLAAVIAGDVPPSAFWVVVSSYWLFESLRKSRK